MYETVGHLDFVKSCRPEAARISKDGKKYHPGKRSDDGRMSEPRDKIPRPANYLGRQSNTQSEVRECSYAERTEAVEHDADCAQQNVVRTLMRNMGDARRPSKIREENNHRNKQGWWRYKL
jgi:hypothetical protein